MLSFFILESSSDEPGAPRGEILFAVGALYEFSIRFMKGSSFMTASVDWSLLRGTLFSRKLGTSSRYSLE